MNHCKLAAAALLCGFTLAGVSTTQPVLANDHIFPSAAAAKSSIDFDARGFLIHGKRTFIVSAGMEYARIPHQLWRDRLLRLKRAGYNCVEVYCFWNWHEAQEGKFNFTGDHDINAFLKQVHALGMYAICRVGPYYCAEWDLGGYPIWLKFKPGLVPREDNPLFEKYVDRFFEQLIPIVAANQVSHGGSVVLVQLENEHPDGWGTDMPNGYFKHLQEKSVSLGLEVPYFFSGLHHGSDPAGDSPNLDDSSRPNPWFTTEFWSVWYDHYGAQPGDAAEYRRRTWKIIAHGGNGYNHYMAHGGSNFGYTNNNEDAASYDYGAAVGQTGDLRPIYYEFKKAAFFARSFQNVLENSVDAGSDFAGISNNPDIRVTARRSPSGTIAFLDNPGSLPVETSVSRLSGAGDVPVKVTLLPGEIVPVVSAFNLGSGVTLDWAPARILGIFDQGNTKTLAVYGSDGSDIGLTFGVSADHLSAVSPEFTTTANSATLNAVIRAGQPQQFSFVSGGHTFRILVMDRDAADRTWSVGAGEKSYLVSGPHYVADGALDNGHLSFRTERGWPDPQDTFDVAYGEALAPIVLNSDNSARTAVLTLALTPWQTRSGMKSAAKNLDDSTWFASVTPQQMGADRDYTADAWYRAKATVTHSGTYQLHFASVRDRAEVFVDGKATVQVGKSPNNTPLTLTRGTHQLAVFTAHDGRDKDFGLIGLIANRDPKGLVGPATLIVKSSADVSLTQWQVAHLTENPGADATPPAIYSPDWQRYTLGDDAYGHAPGWAWFQSVIPAGTLIGKTASISFDSVDDNGTVFVNGKRILTHDGWNDPFVASAGSAWNSNGANVVQVLVENVDGTGGVNKNVTLSAFSNSLPITSWHMRGGPGNFGALTGWSTLRQGNTYPGPEWFKSTFMAPKNGAAHPVYRVVSAGLGHGSVWVNGHNLGRYPEKIPINGLYIPEPWMVPGVNTVVIFDEDGKRPDQVSIQAEKAASRDISILTANK